MEPYLGLAFIFYAIVVFFWQKDRWGKIRIDIDVVVCAILGMGIVFRYSEHPFEDIGELLVFMVLLILAYEWVRMIRKR